MKKQLYLILTVLITCNATVHAQAPDTLHLTLHEAEQRFIHSNLSLLAAKYNIDIAKTEVITSGLYHNPELSFENVLYDPENKRWLEPGYHGQNTAELSQVIILAGKRNKAVLLAQSQVKLSEHEFYDLVRTLTFTLRDNFYHLSFLQRSLGLYDAQIASLNRIVTGFKEQLAKGNIAQKELLRIQSLLYTLKATKKELQQEVNAVSTELKMLTRIDPAIPVTPVWTEPSFSFHPLQELNVQQLLDSARTHRQDLLAAKENVNSQELNRKLQKALAVPDLTVGITYDRQGSYIRDYTGVKVAMPLPLFNRNQGNIRQAESRILQSKTQLQHAEDQLAHEVMQRYTDALNAEALYEGIDQEFDDQFHHLIEEVQKNFVRRNISLLEFIDFYDSYKETIISLHQIRYNRYRALEQINFVSGTQLIHL
ncbi:TolC family protein [Pseudobacter ginsenosidimutans]|jgi:cobalt-zinc-cadmium efflux system outer membrane protein|uniref:Cobalt-zinc-cadmium efflux system outer membrane protein n=1 Tax=Pseudobacter ginsenosidimutans TaxID=661488 RepID=A0A4Q7N037_9BACT|nr:TolC family protein [Pseudobacter ginsenosidimutans]QEC43535.1 TolC family protein [Pseudobacter ginsenosidimutans]RZS74927.1 cobalt-zinc-cadmium efflux system outer membrane protein [Pseudobacter ginsenosidimutans]